MGEQLVSLEQFIEEFHYPDKKSVWIARGNGYLPATLGRPRVGKRGPLVWRRSDLDRYIAVRFEGNDEVLAKLEDAE